MLGQDNTVGLSAENPSEELWVELKDKAKDLVSKLEEGDFAQVSELIGQLNDCRDRTIYVEVGKLTRGLHEAIVNFDIDARQTLKEESDDSAGSQMANAQDRLDYVIKLTQQAADKTMDMVEEGIPLANSLGEVAAELKSDWERLKRREMSPDEFRELYHRIDQHLEKTSEGAQAIGEKFNTILMAQDFQDLTGQVITKVTHLVQEVEDRLVELMRVAGEVEELTGIVRSVESKEETQESGGLDSEAEGPQIDAEKRKDVVSGQDDVDDLLSSLGF